MERLDLGNLVDLLEGGFDRFRLGVLLAEGLQLVLEALLFRHLGEDAREVSSLLRGYLRGWGVGGSSALVEVLGQVSG